jgi:type I restriction enzyme S subunit
MSKIILEIEFGEIATFRNGLNFAKETRGIGCSLIGIPDFKDKSVPDYESLGQINPEGLAKVDDYLAKSDILFVRSNGNKNLVGRTLFINKEIKALYSGFCIRARLTSKKITPLFLFYFTKTERFKSMISSSGGTSIQNLNQEILSKVKLPLLQILAQNKITKVLSDLDAKIELNNKVNDNLEQMAKTLYDYWFVQFDFPDTNGNPYRTSGGKMVWNEELKREIPEGWEVKTFSEWINNDKSGDWGKEQAEGNYTEKVYCIRGADINGLNGTGELKSPERYILEKNLHKTLDPADLIVEISGGSPTQSTGRLAFITEGTLARFDAPIICSNFCKAVTLKNKKLLYNFVYHWKSIYDAGVLFGYEGKTSGIKNLLFDSFVSSHYTVVPEETLAEKFYDFMEPIQAKKQKNLKENQELASLRDWLLPMLMNGQVSVGDFEEELRMVAESGEKYGK